jgi:hypothetical protein
MDTYKLRVKIGPNEFEAEGQPDVVKAQFEEWKTLVVGARLGPSSPTQPHAQGTQHSPAGADAPPFVGSVEGGAAGASMDSSRLGRLFDVDHNKDRVTLKVLPQGDNKAADALLITLYGYKALREKNDVQVTSLKSSLVFSGCLGGKRIDRVAEPHVRKQFLLKRGIGKGGIYTLTSMGSNAAKEIIDDLLKLVE